MDNINKLREVNPLVVCITNDVVKNFTANGLLAVGASPLVGGEVAEAADLMKSASALLINIGTADQSKLQVMDEMMKEANKNNVPIVFDPVGFGASRFRVEITEQLLSRHDVSIIKGNAGEMHALSGAESNMRGVDSKETTPAEEIADKAYNRYRTPVLVTGAQDALMTGNGISIMDNGHALQGRVTGSGCLLGAIICAFLGTSDRFDDQSVIDAVSYYNLCAEKAASAQEHPTPGTFATKLIDELYLNGDNLLKARKVVTG